jgi:hypothetical protein
MSETPPLSAIRSYCPGMMRPFILHCAEPLAGQFLNRLAPAKDFGALITTAKLGHQNGHQTD